MYGARLNVGYVEVRTVITPFPFSRADLRSLGLRSPPCFVFSGFSCLASNVWYLTSVCSLTSTAVAVAFSVGILPGWRFHTCPLQCPRRREPKAYGIEDVRVWQVSGYVL